MNKRLHKLLRKVAMTLLGLFALTSLSCERDVFWVDGYEGNGEPVNVILEFELPQQKEVTVTRTLTDIDEHHIGDFYILIFDENGNRVFGKYYPDFEMNKVEYQGGDWSSVEAHKDHMDEANSTHGYVIAKAVTGPCYIFGFANIGDATDEVFEPVNTLEATAVMTNLREGLTSNRWKLDHVRTLNDLYAVQVDAMSDAKDNILVREQPNLMYSGAWQMFGPYNKRSDYNQTRSAGYVNITGSMIDETTGNVDLRSFGMIYLRTLTSHFKFNIEINEKIFSAFEPESWQVINLPQRCYLMDMLNDPNALVKRAEIDFKESTEMKNNMVHEDAKYVFDFWMFENHKEARTASSTDLRNSLTYAWKDGGNVNDENKMQYSDQYLDTEDEVTGIMTHYEDRFGNKLMQWETSEGSETPLNWLKTVYGYGSREAGKHHSVYGFPEEWTSDQVNAEAIKLFLYNKRELQAKRWTVNNKPVWNRKGDYYPYPEGYPNVEDKEYTKMNYDSKKFIYADDKATYIVIKGRLRFKTTNDDGSAKPIELINNAYNYKDITEGEYLTTHTDSFKDGYADVTYTIHLGDFRDNNDDGLPDYDNFDCLRNTEYIYNVKINSVNSIYTTIETSGISSENIRVKKQHGADGLLNMAMGVVHNTDAHFCQFNMMLTKESLNDFYFEMNTPWNNFSTSDFYVNVNTYDDEGNEVTEKRFIYLDHITKHKTTPSGGLVNDYTTQDQNRVRSIVTNQDFTWFKFSPNTDQRGMFDGESYFTDHKEGYDKVRQTEKYNRALSGITLWNLYEFTLTMESLVAAEKAATPTLESEASPATARARMAALLAQRFECTVGDGAGDDYTGAHALPFMLDEVTYEVSEAVYNKVKTNVDAESGRLARYQSYDSSDGKYYVTEDYVEYLKVEENTNFGDRDIAPIHRMFYTVYLDENYYYEQPYGVTSWVKPYWKHFANQPSRYVNFGYRGEGYTSEGKNAAGYSLSSDGQSGIMVTLLTIVQPSIQTFYSTERINTSEKYEVAIGLEHVNETHDPRWYAGAGSIASPYPAVPESDPEMSTYNGWTLAKKYLSGPGYAGSWDYYVGKEVWDLENGFQNNVIMATSTLGKTTVPTNRTISTGTPSSDDRDNPYLAEAVRMCMNRNRDENGNGKIDESELKWFLPTSRQYELAALGHYSLQDPLFNYNQFVNYSPSGLNPSIERHGAQILAVSNESVQGQNAWKYHYVASDFQTLTSEEMANSPTYGIKQNYQSKPYEMRCMRNLGGEYDKNGNINLPESDYDLPAPYNYVSKTPQSLLFNYDEVNKIFEMTYYDSRTVRGIYYTSEELPKHFLFSVNNLPYYRFQVARNLHSITTSAGDSYEDIIASRPCGSYSQLGDGSDRGSWRMPNHAEMSLMVIQLRQKNESMHIFTVEEMSPPWFFDSSSKVIYSATSWNYTGYYARMLSVNYNDKEGWGIHTTNPKAQGMPKDGPTGSGYPNNPDNFLPNMGELGGTFYVRCVKDVRGDVNNYKEFGSDSENYGQSYGSDSEGFTE